MWYSAGERLKPPVPTEGRNNIQLWYLLVGVLVGLSTWVRVESGAGHTRGSAPACLATTPNVGKWPGRFTGAAALI